MTYRELLQLYKTGQLDEETRARVEKDIQRQDAIGEYLFEESEIPTLENAGEEELPISEENAEFVNLIQKSIRKAFWKLGVSVCAVVLAGALLAVFVLPYVVDMFFYDPTEVVGTDPEYEGLTTDRMSLDLAVWSEAFVPGVYRDQANVTPRGYGAYDLTILQSTSANRTFTNVGGSLTRNRLTLFDPNLLKLPVGNAFVLPGEEDSGAFGSREDAYASIEQLEEDAWYQGYVSLAEVMDYEDFMGWYDGLENQGQDLWCAVWEQHHSYPAIGFYPSQGGYVLNWDEETYPLLSLVGKDVDRKDVDAMTTHFISMVSYLRDHPQFGEMMGHKLDEYGIEYLLEGIQQDGLRLYGFSILAQKETFLTLREDAHVNYMYTVPAR